MTLDEWFRVSWEGDKITLDVAAPGRDPLYAEFEWNSISRVCFKAEGPDLSDGIYVFTMGRPESYVIPIAAAGGAAFWDEVIRRGLFDAELAIEAASAAEGLFCWPRDVVDQSLPALMGRLLTCTPGTSEAEAPQRAIESLLMAALREGGRTGGEKLVESLADSGYVLERLDALPCMWRVKIPRPRVLEIWFTGGEHPVVAALSYREGRPWGTKAQKRAARLQAEFYKRYQSIDPEASALSPHDRMVLLIGELEADINNGGFGQYLDNKGEARAREALGHLSTIGAKRTARWLTAALAPTADPSDLEKLDQEFFERAEDLASLVMAHIEKSVK